MKLYPFLVLLCVLVIVISTFWLMQSLAPESAQTVKITNFSIENKQWTYLGGLTFDCRFNLTIANEGASNLTGLELKVKLFNNGSEVQVGNYFVCALENGTLAETLHVGEVRSCEGTILCNVGDDAYRTRLASNETTILAQVILKNVILDEKRS